MLFSSRYTEFAVVRLNCCQLLTSLTVHVLNLFKLGVTLHSQTQVAPRYLGILISHCAGVGSLSHNA